MSPLVLRNTREAFINDLTYCTVVQIPGHAAPIWIVRQRLVGNQFPPLVLVFSVKYNLISSRKMDDHLTRRRRPADDRGSLRDPCVTDPGPGQR